MAAATIGFLILLVLVIALIALVIAGIVIAMLLASRSSRDRLLAAQAEEIWRLRKEIDRLKPGDP